MAKRMRKTSQTQPAKRRAWGYARVSTLEQAADGESLAVQQDRIQAICTLNGYELAGIFTDEGVSAAKPLRSRPQGRKLWSAAKSGDVVIGVKLDRMFRSVPDAASTLEDFRARGIGLVLADLGHGDLTVGAAAALTFNLLSSVAAFERARIGERTADVMASLKARGRYCGGSAPFGFRILERGGERYIEADTDLQALVLDLHQREYSSRAIVAELRSRSIETNPNTICKFIREHGAVDASV